MTLYEMKTLSSAIVTYAVYGALCFFVGMYKGCDTGYNNGYRQAVVDIYQQEEKPSSNLEKIVKKIEEKRK
jgi:hypothetical protein